ncbi:predicted protein [Aspergillus terreus NIH2624]|uniref:NACHT domain-containing protein n=1 Tax=Aspergillus terreus (strain NIH 2624 / FGSC A1156) TaxID=341663 RepID=Q0C8M7_ASPTN|nr:uncharacterized protein ATEG_09957 [Aspergillus terreus NIH2624]EAU29406.1 predicted protein [Aspergillus terreus NIH2624]
MASPPEPETPQSVRSEKHPARTKFKNFFRCSREKGPGRSSKKGHGGRSNTDGVLSQKNPHRPSDVAAADLNCGPMLRPEASGGEQIDLGTAEAQIGGRLLRDKAFAPQNQIPRPPSEEVLSQELWDDAFESLANNEDTSEFVEAYLHTLLDILEHDSERHTYAAKASGTSAETNAIDVLDHSASGGAGEARILTNHNYRAKRQLYMKELVLTGQAKVAKASEVSKAVGAISEAILFFKPIVDSVINNVPHAAPAALPWAGVCFILQILSNPAKTTKANLMGITHVTTRMDWYYALTGHLLDQDKNEGYFGSTLQQLQQKVLALYKSILLYQIKSVCSYYRHQGLVFLRSLVRLDDWDGDVQEVITAEKALMGDWATYDRLKAQKMTSDLLRVDTDIRDLLGDIRETLWNFTEKQVKHRTEDENFTCVRDLRIVNPQDDMRRIENEKEKVLKEVYEWILEDEEYVKLTNWDESNFQARRLLWVHGPAGTGKTMLLIGIIRELSDQPAIVARTLSYFFCQGTNSDLNNASSIMRSLIWMLVIQQPHLISHLQPDYKASGGTLYTDMNASIALSRAFKAIIKDTRPVYFVVDALDECEQGLDDLLDVISYSLTASSTVRWLVSSRPGVDVGKRLKQMSPNNAPHLAELDVQGQRDCVEKYIDHKLSDLRMVPEIGFSYTDNILAKVGEAVRERGKDQFLWLSLVFNELRRMRGNWAVRSIKNFPSGLELLYDQKMSKIMAANPTLRQRCWDVLMVISLAYNLPLFLSELAQLVPWSNSVDPFTIVRECGSFLTTKDEAINVVHQSAKEYLDEHRQGFHGNIRGHGDILGNSIKAMMDLKRDMYNLGRWDIPSNEINLSEEDPLLSKRYSCVFWLDHLRNAIEEGNETSGPLCHLALSFLKLHFLHWIEALSLLRRIADGISSIKKLLDILRSHFDAYPELVAFLKEAEVFTVYHRSTIERFPLQVYGTAIAFCPTQSEIRKGFWGEKLPYVKNISGIKESWDLYRQVLSGHNGVVSAVAFSPNGKILASGSSDTKVCLWAIDAATASGTPTQTLSGHTDMVKAVAFSPNGQILASASDDQTLRLWTVDSATATIEPKQTIGGHTDLVNAVAFSPDGLLLASASSDKTIRLWYLGSPELTSHMFTGHGGRVNAVTISPDGKQLASASSDKTIALWSLDHPGTANSEFKSLPNEVNAIAFSPNGEMLVSGSSNGELILWSIGPELATTRAVKLLYHSVDSIHAVAFSPDGTKFASASSDATVCLWDVNTSISDTCIARLTGHENCVRSVAFSSDGNIFASASNDATVRLWDIDSATNTGVSHCPETCHKGMVTAVALSPDDRMLASASSDATVRLCSIDPTTGTSIFKQSLYLKSWATTVAFSPDSKLLATGTTWGVVLYEIVPECAEIVSEDWLDPSDSVNAVVWSFNGKMLASASSDQIIYLWNISSSAHGLRILGNESQKLIGHKGSVSTAAFSTDGTILASGSTDTTVRLWSIDASTGAARSRQTLAGHRKSVNALTFSLDNRMLASCSDDGSVRIWNIDPITATGECTRLLRVELPVRSLTFSGDVRYIRTDGGLLSLLESDMPFGHDRSPYVRGEWIIWDGQYLLRLPPGYSATCMCFGDDFLVLGHASGRVTLFQFMPA